MVKPIIKEKRKAIRFNEGLDKKLSAVSFAQRTEHLNVSELELIKSQPVKENQFNKKRLKEIDEQDAV
jgi:hypothetical protein